MDHEAQRLDQRLARLQGGPTDSTALRRPSRLGAATRLLLRHAHRERTGCEATAPAARAARPQWGQRGWQRSSTAGSIGDGGGRS
jgi:hypothetical protein